MYGVLVRSSTKKVPMEIATQGMQGGTATTTLKKIEFTIYISKFHPQQIKSSGSYK